MTLWLMGFIHFLLDYTHKKIFSQLRDTILSKVCGLYFCQIINKERFIMLYMVSL